MPDDQQAANVAEILRRTRPDIVFLDEFDYVEGGAAVDLFRSDYLLCRTTVPSRSTTRTTHRPVEHRGAIGVRPGQRRHGQGGNDAFGFGESPASSG